MSGRGQKLLNTWQRFFSYGTTGRDAYIGVDHANTAKSAFLANMSHELRTPLNAIIGYSEMVGEELADLKAQELKPDLDKVVVAAKHQLAFVNDILDLCKIESGKMTLFLEEFDTASLVNEVASTVQPLIYHDVYILRSLVDPQRHYTGLTQNLRRRLLERNSGNVLHTSKFKTWKIKTANAFEDEQRA